MNPATIAVIVIIFLATLIRSTLGFGEALVAVPLLALSIPVPVAAPLAVMISVLVSGIVVVQDWRKIEMRSAAGLVISALFGIPFGLLLLIHADERIVKALLGLIIVLFSLYSLMANVTFHLKKDHPALLLAAGFCSGILGGAYGMNGPPLVVYGSLRRWSPQNFRATLQGYFLPASLVGLAGYAVSGLWTTAVTRYFFLSLPGALIATAVGGWLNHRMHGNSFFRYTYMGLVVIGTILVMQAFLYS